MADRPILFSSPMVRALLDGRKTQTRRALNPQPAADFIEATIGADGLTMRPAALFASPTHKMLLRLPRPGDRLYVREAFSGPHVCRCLPPRDWPVGAPVWRWADGDPSDGDWTKPKPSLHMPRWASRLTLLVTEVRVERLQDISPFDALAEGMCPDEQDEGDPDAREVEAYRHLWDSLNAERGYGWNANPWVVVVSFTVHQQNIDAIAATG